MDAQSSRNKHDRCLRVFFNSNSRVLVHIEWLRGSASEPNLHTALQLAHMLAARTQIWRQKPQHARVALSSCFLQLNVTVSNHLRDLPELTNSVKFEVITDATRDALTGAWKTWMEETRESAVGCT